MTSNALYLQFLDVRAFYESHGAVVSGKPTNSREGKEYACSCPLCGGTDRASFWESGRFCCVRGCHFAVSSPYWFLREQGYSHQQTCEELNVDPQELFGDSYSHQEVKLPLFLVSDEAPNKKWMEAAAAFILTCEKILWSSKGQTARDYLQSRGLTQETIKRAHLGLCPDWHKASLESWGLSAEQLLKTDDPQIKIPRGITIPWFVGGDIWKIQLRRPDKQYFQVLGSADCLYNVDAIQPDKPVLLVESEIDVLSAQQESGELVACIATGSTSKGQYGRSLAKLHQASHVLQAFDDDEAGHNGAQEWIELLGEEKCTRLTPWAHDVNDMLREQQPLRMWVEMALSDLTEQGEDKAAIFEEVSQQHARDMLGKLIPPALIERVKAFQERPCAHCGGYDWFLDSDGLLACTCLITARERALLPPEPVISQPEYAGYWQH